MMVPRIIRNTGAAAAIMLMALSTLPGCYYDVEENLIVRDTVYVYDTTGGSGCDTMAVSFAQEVMPVFNQQCNVCHSSAAQLGSVVLDNYDDVIIVVESGQLLGAINHETGYSPMPKDGPKLDDCTLAQINAWVHQGAPNN